MALPQGSGQRVDAARANATAEAMENGYNVVPTMDLFGIMVGISVVLLFGSVYLLSVLTELDYFYTMVYPAIGVAALNIIVFGVVFIKFLKRRFIR